MFGPVLDFPELPLPTGLRQWLNQQADRSVIHVSFGSMVTIASSRLRLLASAFARIGAPVLWVMDPNSDLRTTGCLPANVRVEAVVPQPTVLAHEAIGACVTHGGSGTITESLAAGVPMVVMPLMWDQPYNAQFVHELGAGVRCDWWALTGTAFEKVVRTVLGNGEYRDRAAAIARDLRTQDGSAAVAAVVDSLAQNEKRQPQSEAVKWQEARNL
jgi:MGT family glycosyltransferase